MKGGIYYAALFYCHMSDKYCELCGRMLNGDEERHHLIPESKSGKTIENNLVLLHQVCHSKIHHTFSETELAKTYSSISVLRTHEQIQTFIKWIQKKPITFVDKNKDSVSRHRKRKRK